jgi:outer membrane protein assembly factor BamB
MSSPTLANGVIYVASGINDSATQFDGKLYAVNAATGQVLFSSVVSLGQGGIEVGQRLANSRRRSRVHPQLR